MIQIGRFGSASPSCLARSLRPFTVTATLGTVLLPELRTRMRRRDCWATCWLSGNDARATSTSNVPSGSFASWRLPPPQPATTSARSAPSAPVRSIPDPIGGGNVPPRLMLCASWVRRLRFGTLADRGIRFGRDRVSKGEAEVGSFRRRSRVLAVEEPARRGRGHDDLDGQDDHVCPAAAVSVWR